MRNPARILMIAGEASGDLHASEVVTALKRLVPDARFYGVGGDSMRRAGVDVVHDAATLSVVGLFEVLSRLRGIWRVFRSIVRGIRESRPSLAILVDSPDFNLRVAKRLAKAGVPILYFIGPQVWAWRASRLNLMRRLVRVTAVVFPFEEELYRRANVPVSFVGHPLVDRIERRDDAEAQKAEARARLGLADGTWVTLMPGSRLSEVRRLMPRLVGAAERLARRGIRFLLPVAPGLPEGAIDRYLAGSALPIRLVRDQTYDCLRAADVAVIASGTATLESALLGTPMVVVYRLNPLTYLVGRLLVRVRHIAMANILAGRGIVPELIQGAVTPRQIADEVERFIDDPVHIAATRKSLLSVRTSLGEGGAASRVAALATDLLSRE